MDLPLSLRVPLEACSVQRRELVNPLHRSVVPISVITDVVVRCKPWNLLGRLNLRIPEILVKLLGIKVIFHFDVLQSSQRLVMLIDIVIVYSLIEFVGVPLFMRHCLLP